MTTPEKQLCEHGQLVDRGYTSCKKCLDKMLDEIAAAKPTPEKKEDWEKEIIKFRDVVFAAVTGIEPPSDQVLTIMTAARTLLSKERERAEEYGRKEERKMFKRYLPRGKSEWADSVEYPSGEVHTVDWKKGWNTYKNEIHKFIDKLL